jgi:hypothetical protein
MTLRTLLILATELAALALGAELTTDLDLKTLFELDEIHLGAPAAAADLSPGCVHAAPAGEGAPLPEIRYIVAPPAAPGR